MAKISVQELYIIYKEFRQETALKKLHHIPRKDLKPAIHLPLLLLLLQLNSSLPLEDLPQIVRLIFPDPDTQ